MLSEYRKLVYAGDRYNDNKLSFAYLNSILLLQFFFLKIFYRLCVFVFVSFFFFFFFFFFFSSLHIMKKSKKDIYQNNNNLQTGRTNTLLCVLKFSSDYHVKRT